jgi:hypothetical protein
MACIPVRAQQQMPPPAHVTVVVTGDVMFRRPGWTTFAPVRFGTMLRQGDLLNLGAGASAIIVCDGFTTAARVAGQVANAPVPCARPTPPSSWHGNGALIPTARIDIPSSSLTPGALPTWTYDDTPAFAWLAVPGADSYEVNVHGSGVDWTWNTSETTVGEPGAMPKLKEEQGYSISITPKFHDKPLPEEKELMPLFKKDFRVVSRPSSRDVDARLAAAGKLGLPAPIATFLAGRILATSGAYDKAIAMLQAIRAQLDEPALRRELGEVYSAKGSYSDAERFLIEAMQLYEKNGDVFSGAIAHEAIASVHLRSASRIESAIIHLDAALQTYRKLGDKPDAERVQAVIASLTKLKAGMPRRPRRR